MNKYELISGIAKHSGLTHNQVRKCLTGLLKVIKETLINEEKISIRGLGTFRLEETKVRKGYNIQTGQTVDISSRKIVRFRMSSWLLDLKRLF
ncbi:HU family DNA-binding protein [Bacteroides uniformis]|uniref:HU family DNA-binding protein n=1 Tax=Bacteroides uniformis TaxID=820 RepID=UPI003B522723